jgi:hypothetical protein
LRKIRPNIPVMIECRDQIDGSPVSDCMRADDLTSQLHHLLTEEATV